MAGNWWDKYQPVATPLAPKMLSGGDQKRISDMEGDVDESGRLAASANDFIERNKRTATGGWLGIPFTQHIAGALGLGGDDLSAMDRDSIQMATQLRAPGQRLTQMEFSKNLGATPSIGVTGDKNGTNARGINNVHVGALAKASFFRTWGDKYGTLSGADAAWERYRGQHFGDDGTFYQDPAALQRARQNANLKGRSAQAGQPVANGGTIDIFGRPVQ